MKKIKSLLLLFVALSLSSRAFADSIVVPGSANPWLADATTAAGGDTAPGQSPVIVDLDTFVAGDELTFIVTGSVSYGGGTPTDTPDGSIYYRSLFHLGDGTNGGPENGLAGLNAPANALLGAFVGPTIPVPGPTPQPFLDFTVDGNVPGNIDYTSLAPELDQPFFIGDGVNASNERQRVVMPPGATRLVLGSMDGSGWYNNTGSFSVGIARPAVTSQIPATTLLLNGTTNPPDVTPDSVLNFQASQSSTQPNLAVRVQTSSTPATESSWVDLADENDGRMVYDVSNGMWSLNTTTYPRTTNLHFRAISFAPGFIDSISNVIGPFDLQSTVLRLGPLHFSVNGSDKVGPTILPNEKLSFTATESSSPSGIAIRVQYSSTPHDESSWTDLSGATFPPSSLTYQLNDYLAYPDGAALYLRAIASAPGYVDEISNAVGPFNLEHSAPPVVVLNPPAGQSGTGSDAQHPIVLAQGGFSYSADVTSTQQLASVSLLFDGSVIRSGTSNHITSEGFTSTVIGVHKLSARASDTLGAVGISTEVFIRIVPPTGKSYTLAKNGNWTDATSWSPAGVPGALDSAELGSLTATIPSGQQITVASVSGGNITGPGTLTVTKQFTWTKGTLQNLTLILPAGAFGSVYGSVTKTLKTVTIENHGYLSIDISNPATIKAGLTSTLVNYGTFDMGEVEPQFALLGFGLGLCQNYGLCLLHGVLYDPNADPSAANGSVHAEVTAGFQQISGSVDLGPTDRPGGIAGDVVISGGTMIGSGTITGNLTNESGFVRPGHSTGTIFVGGNFTQTGNGALILEANSTYDYDQLIVNGAANLGGTLSMHPSGGFTPTPTDIFAPLAYSSVAGDFDILSANAAVSLKDTGAIVAIDSAVPAPESGKPLNISTRLNVQAGDDVLIAGFIVNGPEGSTKRVLIRALGPTLGDFGVSGALANPVLELHPSGGAVIINDDWKSTQQAEIAATMLQPPNDLESAIIATLPVGAHTAIVSGSGGETGVGLVEVYDLEGETAGVQLANISTRGKVEAGDNVMIGGFIVGGTEPTTVLVRALGPSLTDFGVAGALADPVLELHDSDGNTIVNDDWRFTQELEISTSGLAPGNDAEASISATLVPGAYTAIVRGKDDTTGVALIEVYNLQ